MMQYDYNAIILFLPKVCQWIENQENFIACNGINLSEEEIEIAKIIGIKNYDVIKVYESPIVPNPDDIVLLEIGKNIGLISPHTNGICFRYGIFINENTADKKGVLVHELIHTLQYEQYGTITHFINQYVKECIELGYHNSPLELEAITKTNLFLNPKA